MFYAFKGFVPVVHPSSFVHPQAAVTGNVVIGRATGAGQDQRMHLGAALGQRLEHVLVVTVAELAVLARDDHDRGAISVALGHALAHFDDGVEQRGA